MGGLPESSTGGSSGGGSCQELYQILHMLNAAHVQNSTADELLHQSLSTFETAREMLSWYMTPHSRLSKWYPADVLIRSNPDAVLAALKQDIADGLV